MAFTRIYMANPDQKTILIEQTSKDIIEIRKNFKMIQDHHILKLKLF